MLVFLLTVTEVYAAEPARRTAPDEQGEIVLRTDVLGAPLTLQASLRFGGALYSLNWRGQEYLNAWDHGRELQTALSFDQFGECYNPTEAGSGHDDTGPFSSSVLRSLSYTRDTLETTTDMAFWLQPGQPYPTPCTPNSPAHEAQNHHLRDGYLLKKRVHVGHGALPNVLEYDLTITTPRDHQQAAFELITGYMPPEFALFLGYDVEQGHVMPISDGPGEQAFPVILSTLDLHHAMGIFAPDLLPANAPTGGFGRFRFVDPKAQPGPNTVKWNAAYRLSPAPAGDYRFRCYVIVGTVPEILRAMDTLYQEDAASSPRVTKLVSSALRTP